MTAVQEHASLHEKAVQKVAQDQHDLPKRRRRGRGKQINGRVQSTRVHPLVMEWLRETKVPQSHVQILPSGEVVVWNHTHWKGSAEATALAAKHRGHGPRKEAS